MRVDCTEIGGRPVEMLLPDGPIQAVLIFLHGYDGVTLKDRAAYHAALTAAQAAAVCPLGPRCWWTQAAYPPFDPVRSPVSFLCKELAEGLREVFPGVDRPWSIFGFEMGGQGALQAAYRAPRVFPHVAAISPKVDFETWYGYGTSLDELFPDRESARQHIATLQVNPLNWPRRQLLLSDPHDVYCHEGVLTLASKLSSSGIPFERDFETSRGGFGWDYVDSMAPRVVEFLTSDDLTIPSGKIC